MFIYSYIKLLVMTEDSSSQKPLEQTLDENTAIMRMHLNNSSLASRALRGAIRKINPQADISEFPHGDGIIFIGLHGPVIKYYHTRVDLYHNWAEEKTKEFKEIYSRNYLKMPHWVTDN